MDCARISNASRELARERAPVKLCGGPSGSDVKPAAPKIGWAYESSRGIQRRGRHTVDAESFFLPVRKASDAIKKKLSSRCEYESQQRAGSSGSHASSCRADTRVSRKSRLSSLLRAGRLRRRHDPNNACAIKFALVRAPTPIQQEPVVLRVRCASLHAGGKPA